MRRNKIVFRFSWKAILFLEYRTRLQSRENVWEEKVDAEYFHQNVNDYRIGIKNKKLIKTFIVSLRETLALNNSKTLKLKMFGSGAILL